MSQPYDPNAAPQPGVGSGFPAEPTTEFVGEQPNRAEFPGGAQAWSEPQPDVRPLSSIGDIVGSITSDVSTLIRQETELAKAELKQSASRAGKGAGMLAGAGVATHLALIFASLTLWYVLADAFDSMGWAFFAVTLLWGIIAAVLAVSGRGQLNKIQGIPNTTETVKEIPDALKGNEETR